MVVFDPDEPIDVVTSRAEEEKSILTAFFEFNRNNEEQAIYTYQEAPLHLVWDRTSKIWSVRQHMGSIGRLNFVLPTAGERFYLRTLLTTVKGPTSWQDLRTYDGILHDTFHGVCLARGLLEHDDEWRQCLKEASSTHAGHKLRSLFSLILRHCTPSQPDKLWEEFKDSICDDLERTLQRQRPTATVIPLEDIFDYGLFLIDQDLHHHGSTLALYPSMPRWSRNWENKQENPYLIEQLAFNRDIEWCLAQEKVQQLNTDQHIAFDEISAIVESHDSKLFFIHEGGGTRKTFVYHTLCYVV
jgi:hypothetical protein